MQQEQNWKSCSAREDREPLCKALSKKEAWTHIQRKVVLLPAA